MFLALEQIEIITTAFPRTTRTIHIGNKDASSMAETGIETRGEGRERRGKGRCECKVCQVEWFD